jgi:hypothetical protein
MAIKTTILMEFAPDYFPSQDYQEVVYLENEEVRYSVKQETAITSEKWRHNMYLDYAQRPIQSFSQERYRIDILATESQNINLIEKAGRVKITPQDGDSYYIYNVEITDDFREAAKTHIYTIEYSKDNILNIATYLASNDVKDWFDRSPTENYVNQISFTVENASYIGYGTISNNLHATYGKYNFRFVYTNEYDDISVDDTFYCHYNDLVLQIDYRTICVGKDSEYIYFALQMYLLGASAINVPDIEITLNQTKKVGDFGGVWLDSELTDNIYTDNIYTFLFSKSADDTDLGETTEQIRGIPQYQEQKYKDTGKVLVYLRPNELYKIHKLQQAKPENIKFYEFNKQGFATSSRVITMEGLVNKSTRNDLNELLEYEITFKYNNFVVNVNR